MNSMQFVDPRSFAVMGADAAFRQSSFDGGFNPTKTTPPFFQIFDKEFLKVLGASPSINEIASNATFAFAHEAPIYFPTTGEVFFGSHYYDGVTTRG
jgi:gluconolactonase